MSHRRPLVGRRTVIDQVVQAVTGDDRRAIFVVVTGVTGAGTTAVLDAVTERLVEGDVEHEVRRTIAVTWESSIPYGIVGQLVPEADPEVSISLPFAEQVHLLATSLALVSRGLVLVVDDSEHADVESLRLLASVVRQFRSTPLTLVCGRHDGVAADSGVLEVLDRAADVVFTVPLLSSAEISEMAAMRGVVLTQSASAHLTRFTGGRPRHTLALMDELPRDIWKGVRPDLPPPSFVQNEIRDALAGCSDAARRLAYATAIMTAPTALSVVCVVAQIDGAPWTCVDAVERAGVVVVQRRSAAVVLSIPDAMVRAAILDGLPRRERSLLHTAAALAVDDEAEALAHRVEAVSGPDARLSDQLDEVAVQRASTGEWAAAAQLYELSSRSSTDLHKRNNRMILAVDAMLGAGDVPSAAGYVAEIESLRETPMRSAVLGYMAILKGRPSEADARLTRAWELVRTRHDPEVAAMICHRQVLHNLARCNGAELVVWADRAVELVGSENPTAIEAQSIRGLGLGGTGHTHDALDSYKDLWVTASTGAVGQRIQMGAGWLHLATDYIDDARTELEAAAPTDFLGGSTRISSWAHAWLARTYFVTGEWDAALRVVTMGVDLVDGSGAALIGPLLRWTATQIHALRGDWSAAGDSARMGDAGARQYEIMRVPAALGRAAIAEARADYAGVIRALAPLTETWAQADVSEPGFWPWPDVYANALVVEGRLDEADSFLRLHELRVAASGHRSASARLACARGRWHGARGDLDAARMSFETALAVLAPLPLIYDRARVNFVYGQTLRRAGKRRDAEAAITSAREDYQTLGASAYVGRCDRELKAGGINAVRTERRHDSLTPQEDAVAELVSTGMSNREVAAELFLSVKTVQFHLTRVYSKLGLRSRSELAARSSGKYLGNSRGHSTDTVPEA